MADMVVARLKEHRHRYKFEHLAYESAGHAIRTTYGPTTRSMGSAQLNLGGQPAANARAQADSWPKALAFLKDGLKKALASPTDKSAQAVLATFVTGPFVLR